jgi:hypothetical protein
MQLGRKLAEGYAVDLTDEPELAEPVSELADDPAETAPEPVQA